VDASEEEAEARDVEGPAKVTLVRSTVTFHARLAFVDFAGVHDKRSLEMLIPLIHPRKLILLGGTKEETMALAAECQNLLSAKAGVDLSVDAKSVVDIFTPLVGQTVDASVDTNAWMVKLSRALVKRLKWQNVRSLGVVALTGQLLGPEAVVEDTESEPSRKKQLLQKEDANKTLGSSGPVVAASVSNKDDLPLLDVLPPNLVAATRSVTRPLHVGDLRLADLRKLLQTSGHSAEFRGEGTLLIDGFVVVRKSGAGRIEIEGAAHTPALNPQRNRYQESSFLAVKRKVYDCLAIVAGG
jgi:cleavage and polyadenylation specificity factor subunit 2